jgi:hypothetical protein
MDCMIIINKTQNIGKSELLLLNNSPVCVVYQTNEQCLSCSLLRAPSDLGPSRGVDGLRV